MIKINNLLLFFILMTCNCYANDLNIVTEEYPPYNFTSKDGKIIEGISSDIVLEIAKRANVHATIRIYPWARALHMAESNGNTCVISTFKTKLRDDKFKWIGPIVSDHLALFTARNSKIRILSIVDAKKYLVGTYIGSATIPILEKYGIKSVAASNDNLNLRMLNVNRIDMWIANSKTGPYIAHKEGVEVKQVFVFDIATDMYMACNKQMPNEMVNNLNNLLKQIANDGTRKNIENKYLSKKFK
jgi:polar amino acid transport system substrate-binding protein